MTLLVVRSVVRGALITGLAMALAVGLVDALYAAAGVAGAAPLLQIGALKLVLGLARRGGADRARRCARCTARSASGSAARPTPRSATPRRAFATAFAATASNPLTIASWAAVFAATTTAGATDSAAGTVALLIGVGLGSLGWYVALTCVVALARRHIGDGLVRGVDLVAGAGLVVFGGLLGARSISES